MPTNAPDPDVNLVSVLATTEFAAVPMATAALEAAGIEFMVSDRGMSNEIMGQRSRMSIGETETPVEIFVRAEDEAAARAALRDFAAGVDGAPTVPNTATALSSGRAAAETSGPVELFDESSGAPIGRISDAALKAIQDCLEEESVDDRDYYIDAATIALLETAGVDDGVVALLRRALGGRDGVDIRWERR